MTEPTSPGQVPSSRRKGLRLLVVLIVVSAIVIWRLGFSPPPAPGNIIFLSGRIEGDDSVIASRTSGRIVEIRFREGDTVQAGETIAIFDDQQLRAREDQARAAVAVSEARERATRSALATLQEQLERTRMQSGQSRTDSSGRVAQAEAALSGAEAELAQQEASLALAVFDRDAYTRLAETGAVSERQSRQAIAVAEQQEAAVAAAGRRVDAARGALTTARASLENPNILAAEETVLLTRIAEQEAEIAAAAASSDQARSALVEAQANREDLIVVAPFDGTVITRSAEPGEVVPAGSPLVTLLDLDQVYLRGFVPEGRIGRVRVGQPARVYLDSSPNEAIEAFVSRVDPEAAFTPENTYFQEDRVTEVVGVKLELEGAFGFAKPGMPANGEILVEGDQWPDSQEAR